MKFRKKPIIIEAMQWDGTMEGYDDLQAWARSHDLVFVQHSPPKSFDTLFSVRIKTLEGILYISANDWVIRGVKGELYPCKPDIFEKSYDACE